MRIVYFSPIAFDDLKQRPQLLAEELSKVHEVWYIDPTITGMRCLKKGGKDFVSVNYSVNSNLHVLRLNGLFGLHIKLQQYDSHNVNTWFERIQLKRLLIQADIIWIGYEACYRLIRPYKKRKDHNQHTILIYDKMDDNVALEQNNSIKKFLAMMRQELEKDADIIFVSAQVFYATLSKRRKHVYLLPNGVGFETISGRVAAHKQKNTNKSHRCFGYIGMISHWFDQELIRALAIEMPECTIALVGPVETEKLSLPNVCYYGRVPKSDVKKWIESFDVCLYPFKKGPLLDTIDPVKLYEYLALNKPVVAARSLETKKYGTHVYTYNTPEEFLNLCKSPVLLPPFSTEIEKEDFFNANSWSNRGQTAIRIIDQYYMH